MRTFVFIVFLSMLSLSAQDITPKIVGGKDAPPGDYPWMVGIMDRNMRENYQAQFCGGVLIHPYYVLTAAHCVEGESIFTMNVLVGTQDLDSGGRRVGISKIIPHPNFNRVTLDYDLALLRLSTPVTDIEPIGLADDFDWQVEGTIGRVIGWGQYTLGGLFPTNLQEGDVSIRNYDQANSDWLDTLTTRMLPAASSGGLPDTCGGDSGGPLLVRRPQDNQWVIAGITSFGAGCGEDDPPAVYTRVFSFRDYIYSYIYPFFYAYATSYDQYSLYVDSDNDSLSLIEEYGFNLNPNNGSLVGLPRSGSVTFQNQTYATITFHRRRNMNDFKFQLEEAATLTGPWKVISLSANTLNTTNLDVFTEVITARADVPIDQRPFLRLTLLPTGSL